MPLEVSSRVIADNQKKSYTIGLIVGIVLYLIVLSFNNWDPVSLLESVIRSEFSLVTGIIMRFLSGLGLALTYTTFCVLFFRILSPTLKGKQARTRLATAVILVPGLILSLYSLYAIWRALFLSQPLSFIDFILTIFGVWSLMILVYVVPAIRGEYTPDLDLATAGRVQQKVGHLRFSIWRGFQSRLLRNYGRVAEVEFGRYGSQLFLIRVILSGLLLLPISLILLVVPPLMVFGILLWIRIFSLNHRHFSDLERGLLVLVALAVAVVTTVLFIQPEMVTLRLFLDSSYGFGLMTGLSILFAIIVRD